MSAAAWGCTVSSYRHFTPAQLRERMAFYHTTMADAQQKHATTTAPEDAPYRDSLEITIAACADAIGELEVELAQRGVKA